MSQGLYGSICINDLFGQAIQQDAQGNQWVNLSALQGSAIKRGEKNGKIYLNIGVWLNDQLDQYGNIAGISISQSQEERQSGAKRVYIGNLKPSGQQQASAPTQQQPVAQTPWGTPAPAQMQPAQPAPQAQVQQAQQQYYPQQAAPQAAPVPQYPQAAPQAGAAPYAGNNDLPF